MQRCRALLSAPGSARDAAARLLGSLLARPDMAAALDGFAMWATDALGAAGPEAVFLVPGGRPADLKCNGQRVWHLLSHCLWRPTWPLHKTELA